MSNDTIFMCYDTFCKYNDTVDTSFICCDTFFTCNDIVDTLFNEQ